MGLEINYLDGQTPLSEEEFGVRAFFILIT